MVVRVMCDDEILYLSSAGFSHILREHQGNDIDYKALKAAIRQEAFGPDYEPHPVADQLGHYDLDQMESTRSQEPISVGLHRKF